MSVVSPRPPGARKRPRSLIDVDLDPAQRGAAERAPGGAMLILGEAGHGKTTVALHRLAHLYKSR
jgi:DNA helicase-2/ATP-dependent DNA helicase PcrA